MTRTRRVALATLAIALALPLGARSAELDSDPAHTSATFSVKHLTLTTVGGSIGVKSAKVSTASDDTLTSADATLDLAMIDTKNSQRDDDLKSDHWFDVAKYPTMTFKSTKITGGKDAMTIVGDLTFHGITKPVTLTAKFDGTVKDGRGRSHVGYSATGTIDRTMWNVGNSFPSAIVGNDITLDIELESIVR